MGNLVSRLVDCIHNPKVYEDKEAVKQEQEEAREDRQPSQLYANLRVKRHGGSYGPEEILPGNNLL